MSVINCRHRGVVIDVYVGRPSKWGNPFVIGKDGSREDIIAKYEAWIKKQPYLMAALPELKGKSLGCWCAPLACHADVLDRLANERALGKSSRRRMRRDDKK